MSTFGPNSSVVQLAGAAILGFYYLDSGDLPKRPRPVVICGPSGVGKGTLIELLQKRFPDGKFGFSVSHTTRKPREGEVNGVHYHFTTVEDIRKDIEDGKFIEYAEVHGNYYGTSIASVESVQGKNLICLLDIDVQGAQKVKASSLDAHYLFIAPPSTEELESRLRGRGTESEDAIQRRLANARGELEYGLESGNFDAVLVNNDLGKTLEKMVEIFRGWFPELLPDDTDKKGASQTAVPSGPQHVPPPIVDPLSFPRTDDGLKALLAEVDRDCPLDGYVQIDLCYQASDIHVPAGRTLDVPLPPIEKDGSKVQWSVTVIDPYNERLDIDFGLVVIVDGEEVVAREMGRIASPVSDDGNGDEDGVSAKGKFTVANSAPVTVVLKFDNSYSWIKPKKVKYSFNITSPIDENMIQRSLRAKSVLSRILEGQAELMKAREGTQSRAKALAGIQKEMENKMIGLAKQMDDDKKYIESIQKSSNEAEEEAMKKANEIREALAMAKQEEKSIDELTMAIRALEDECARLKKKWEELKIERKVREEEKSQKEKTAEQLREERVRLQDEILTKKEEHESKLKEMESVEKERSLLKSNLDDLEKEKKAREEEELKIATEVRFLQRQFDAVKLRLME
ncbi:hypothetical protein ACHAXA_006019 [Cyclostephanos tholiformis]|uniref:guanylate kinase n=1 Tax=Cyclostephanos tholiformis TaxID=382380 RepID=A0ABD3SQQ7_9STRA